MFSAEETRLGECDPRRAIDRCRGVCGIHRLRPPRRYQHLEDSRGEGAGDAAPRDHDRKPLLLYRARLTGPLSAHERELRPPARARGGEGQRAEEAAGGACHRRDGGLGAGDALVNDTWKMIADFLAYLEKVR